MSRLAAIRCRRYKAALRIGWAAVVLLAIYVAPHIAEHVRTSQAFAPFPLPVVDSVHPPGSAAGSSLPNRSNR